MVNEAHFGNYTETEAWKRFIGSIKSSYTEYVYSRLMRKFIETAQIVNIDALPRANRKILERRIIDYIKERQDKHNIRGQTISSELTAIKHFLVYNDRTDLNWTIIKGYVKEPVKSVKDRAYTIEEIRQLLTYADLRTKVTILLMASSGMRVGALETLKIKHFKEVKDHDIYAIYVYENTPDEYLTAHLNARKP